MDEQYRDPEPMDEVRQAASKPFSPGDIIIEVDTSVDEARHALIVVPDSNGKTVIHSTNSGQLQGVIQQSVGALRHTDDHTAYEVFRCNQQPVAVYAARFAITWATRSDDPHIQAMANFASGRNETVSAEVRFGRHSIETQTTEEWSAESLVRAVRAWHRGVKGIKLSSNKGVSCSQFITYCYQAASLHESLKRLAVSNTRLGQMLKNPASFIKLKKNNRYNLVYEALEPIDEHLLSCVAPPMRVDAKTTDAENLKSCLDEDEGFDFVGVIAMDDTQNPTRVWIIDDTEY